MKKLISIMLAILMVMAVAVTAIPTTVFAAGNTTQGAADANFKIGNQYYSTLKAALDDAKDGDTIDMLKNVDDPTTARLGYYSKNLTINGNGFTYTAKKNTNQYLFYLEGGKTLTVNNLNMVVQSGLGIANSGGTINLNNCDILSTHRMAIRTSGAKYAEFNLNNTVLEINSDTNANGAQAEPLVYFDGTDYNILNLTGTSKLIRSTKTTGNTGNCSIINVVAGAGYTEINVGAQAEIVLNQATGNSNAPHGIYNGGKGLVAVNLEAGATMKIDSAINATPYFFYGGAAVGFAINDEGANFLVKSGKTPGTYLSDFTVWESVTSPVSGYTAFKPIAPVASGSAAVEAIGAGNVIRYYNGGVKYTNNIKTATDGAADGSVIHVLGDFTQTSANALVNVTKKVSFNGYGHTMYFNNNTAGGTFPLTFDANSAVANFEKIYATTGVINVKSGTVAFTNAYVESGNRAALKFTGGAGKVANIMVKDSVISTATSTPNTEAPVIIENNGTATFRLRDGAIIRRNNPTKGNVDTQAAVIYCGTGVTGSYTINMEAGSMISTNAASGNANGSVLAFNTSKGAKLLVNMAEGAYLASESENITNLTFVYTNAGSSVKINAPEGAFIANSAVDPTIQNYNTSGAYGHKSVAFVDAEATLDGYRQYSMGEFTNDEEFFTFTNVFGETIPVAYNTAFSLPAGSTVKLTADRTVPANGKTVSGNLTIDLNGFTLSDGTSGNYVVSSITGALTVKNGTWNVKRGFVVQGSGVLTFDGVTGNATERPYIKLNSGTATANINNSTITNTANGENVILIENATVGTLNVTGNSYVAHKGGSKGGTNCAVVMITGTASATINVGAGATMSSAYQVEGTQWGGVIVSGGSNTSTNTVVTLETGAKLAIERKTGAGGEAYFVRKRDDANHKIDVIDKGAFYTVNAAICKDGFYLPTIKVADGETLIGFTASDGEIYKTGKNKAASEETVTFTAMCYGADDFDMINGASIRTVKDEPGIRFSSYVSNALLNALGNKVKFGTVIAPGVTVEDDPALHNNSVTIKCSRLRHDFVNGSYTYENSFHAAIIMPTNIPVNKVYELSLAARAFMEITYADGTTAKFYTDFDKNNIRSMADVAYNLGEDAYNNNSAVKDIVDNSSKYTIDVTKNGTGIGIVYGANGNSTVAQLLADAIAAKTGVAIAPAAVGAYNASTFEIVIGDNTYAESNEVIASLGYGEGIIKVIGNKIIIAAYDSESLTLAVNKFIESLDYLTDGNGDIAVPNNYKRTVAKDALLAELPVMSGFTPTTTNTGDDCYMIEFSSATTYNNYLALLTQSGYRVYATLDLEGNVYTTYTNDNVVITAIKAKTYTNGKILIEWLKNTELPTRAEDNIYTPVDGVTSSITQIGLWYDSNGNAQPKDSEGYYTNYNGMSYVIRLDDGSFIVIDGGTTAADADHLYQVLCKQAPDSDNIVIAAWIITHAHSDHVGAFNSFSSRYGSKVTVERFIYNFPSEGLNNVEGAGSALQTTTQNNMRKYFSNAAHVKAHPGQVFNIRNAKITMLFTLDVYEGSETSYNITSLVFNVEIEGKSFFVFGDIYDKGDTVSKLYTATTLKSDIMQVAHHGISGISDDWGSTFSKNHPYRLVGAEYAFWPVAALTFNWKDGDTVHNSTLASDRRNKYMTEMDQSKVFVAADDVVVMTVNNGTISTATFADVSTYVNS